MSPEQLLQENRLFQSTGGASPNNRGKGMCAAFRDSATGDVYLSRFADGRPASVHLLDGLPDTVVLARDPQGRVTNVKQTVVAGFLYAECFYTREQAAGFLASR